MTANLPAAFAGIANRVSAALGAPFYDAQVLGEATPGYTNDDGNWVPGTDGTPRPCRIQIDGADEYMKAVEGFADKEVQIIILTASLDGTLDTDATVNVTDARAPAMFQGQWLVSSLTLDPAGIGWAGKGKRA